MEEERTERRPSKWRTLKQKLGLKALACCGSPWAGPAHTNHMALNQDDNELDYSYEDTSQDDYSLDNSQQHLVLQPQTRRDLQCLLLHQHPATATAEEMNLASALQAERQLRAAAAAAAAAPASVSLMRLLEEKEREEREKSNGDDNDSDNNEENCDEGLKGQNCCVCMGSRKGAAFIPCGHTFCRGCARELWLDRGACPLCNRSIIEILDIF